MVVVYLLFLQWRIITKLSSMKVIKVSKILSDLRNDGWIIVHQTGSHRQLKHPIKKGKVTVNGKPSVGVTGDLLKSIEKQSGLEF
jgi:predicted RNA binding protein YcfA (HicA-like mRNA interferase family)